MRVQKKLLAQKGASYMNVLTKVSVCLAVGLMTGTLAVSAAVTEVDATSTTGFTVSSTDLINGVLPTVTGSIVAEEGVTDGSGTGSPLTNGAFGTPGLSGANAVRVV